MCDDGAKIRNKTRELFCEAGKKNKVLVQNSKLKSSEFIDNSWKMVFFEITEQFPNNNSNTPLYSYTRKELKLNLQKNIFKMCNRSEDNWIDILWFWLISVSFHLYVHVYIICFMSCTDTHYIHVIYFLITFYLNMCCLHNNELKFLYVYAMEGSIIPSSKCHMY